MASRAMLDFDCHKTVGWSLCVWRVRFLRREPLRSMSPLQVCVGPGARPPLLLHVHHMCVPGADICEWLIETGHALEDPGRLWLLESTCSLLASLPESTER